MLGYKKGLLAAGLLVMISISASLDSWAADRVYIGEQKCRACHHNAGQRDQYNKWRLTKHANAYAVLAMPESQEIAKLSGIADNPFDSPVCLGCHATASNVEDWELDETFHIQDGVQCELCHGSGSEYAELDVMRNPNAAMMAGLKMPTEQDCMICHKDKGSHLAVLKVKKFDYKMALGEIAHSGKGGPIPEEPKKPKKLIDGPKYVGAMSCAECHRGAMMGYAVSKWRLSSHSKAFAVLGTQKAKEIAKKRGIEGNPQQAEQCLKCHSTGHGEQAGWFTESFDVAQGVQCESCHGPGSEYMLEAVMLDPIASRESGLWKVNRETCLRCHPKEVDGKPFDYEKAVKKIEHFKKKDKTASAGIEYKTPFNIAVSRDGERLYIACEASDSLIVVEAASGQRIAEIQVENLPHGVCLSPDQSQVFVSNRGADTVSVIDSQSFAIIKTIPVGDEPHQMTTNLEGTRLYVANAGSDDVSIVDIQKGQEAKRLSAARGAWGVSRSSDGESVYVTNNLSHFVKFREPCRSEVTVIETKRDFIDTRIVIPEANLVQGVDCSPDGEFALVTMVRTKNLVPMTRVIQGWVMTNTLGVLWKDGRVDQLPLDELDNGFADPTDVVITPDGKYAYVTGGGIDAVAVIDLDKMKSILKNATDEERKNLLPNHLGVSTEFILKRITVGIGPRGLTVSPDGKYVYVADALDDAISVIDVAKQERIKTIDLGGPQQITEERMGERIFHNAEVTFGRQFSCHSCHPDGGVDGVTYDIEPDGIGINPVDNRTLRGILDTAPFKWTGKNPSLSRQCGPRLAVFFTRIDPFTPEQVKALDRYICTIPRNPNRFRLDGEMTPAQRRGKIIFERTMDNSGKEIPLDNRCNSCHPAPYYTSRDVVNIGVISELDTDLEFDIPHLNNIYETAPYMHDGRAETLEEIWTRYNPFDRHGVTNDMTKDQLKDLVEYLKTL